MGLFCRLLIFLTTAMAIAAWAGPANSNGSYSNTNTLRTSGLSCTPGQLGCAPACSNSGSNSCLSLSICLKNLRPCPPEFQMNLGVSVPRAPSNAQPPPAGTSYESQTNSKWPASDTRRNAYFPRQAEPVAESNSERSQDRDNKYQDRDRN